MIILIHIEILFIQKKLKLKETKNNNYNLIINIFSLLLNKMLNNCFI